jgi:predicted metalloprotease with PDZ domain
MNSAQLEPISAIVDDMPYASTAFRLVAGAIALASIAIGSPWGEAVLDGQQAAAEYHVRIAADASQAEVRAVIPVGATRLFMDPVQADHLPEGWATFVRDLDVRVEGTPVRVERLRPPEWRLPPEAKGPVTFAYRVDLRFAAEPWPAGNEQAGARFDDALYLVGRALFVDTDWAGIRRITFELPRGWRVSSPWKPAAENGLTFEAEDSTDLTRNSIVIGRHTSVRVAAGPFDLELALPGPAHSARPLVDPVLRRVLAAYVRLFPNTPPTRYLMTFFIANAEDGESFSRSAAFTSRESIAPDGLIVWGNFLAHELFHFWNGQRIRGEEPRTAWRWMAEGFTEYYANVTLSREGIIPAELFLKKAERHLGNYLYFKESPAFERMSLVDAGTDTGVNRLGVYDGGWTVAFCLDGLIRAQSRDARSLDDFMRELWRRAQSAGAGYSVSGLDALADELAGRSLGGFFARHVQGLEALPVRNCLARVGIAAALKGYAAEAFLFPDRKASPAAVARARELYGPRVSLIRQ